jgi:hypothetical protein
MLRKIRNITMTTKYAGPILPGVGLLGRTYRPTYPIASRTGLRRMRVLLDLGLTIISRPNRRAKTEPSA